jgi:hypothetical protein
MANERHFGGNTIENNIFTPVILTFGGGPKSLICVTRDGVGQLFGPKTFAKDVSKIVFLNCSRCTAVHLLTCSKPLINNSKHAPRSFSVVVSRMVRVPSIPPLPGSTPNIASEPERGGPDEIGITTGPSRKLVCQSTWQPKHEAEQVCRPPVQELERRHVLAGVRLVITVNAADEGTKGAIRIVV